MNAVSCPTAAISCFRAAYAAVNEDDKAVAALGCFRAAYAAVNPRVPGG